MLLLLLSLLLCSPQVPSSVGWYGGRTCDYSGATSLVSHKPRYMIVLWGFPLLLPIRV